MEQLEEKMNIEYNHLLEDNIYASEEQCNSFIDRFNKDISNKMNYYTNYDEFSQDLVAIMAEY